jgi:hypothetical protein
MPIAAACVLAAALASGTVADVTAHVPDPAPALAVAPNMREAGKPVKYYKVRDNFNGQPEFLFEIAARFLGDGNRAPEIFKLNEGRPQPDGLRVTDPAVIKPGWILQLPADAAGDGVQVGELPTFTAAPRSSRPVSARPSAHASSSTGANTGGSDPGGSGLGLWPFVIGILVLIALLVVAAILRPVLVGARRGARGARPAASAVRGHAGQTSRRRTCATSTPPRRGPSTARCGHSPPPAPSPVSRSPIRTPSSWTTSGWSYGSPRRRKARRRPGSPARAPGAGARRYGRCRPRSSTPTCTFPPFAW